MRISRFVLAAMAAMYMASNADAIVVRSPTVGETFAYARMTDHRLRWIPSLGELVADITFSNVDYMSREEPKHEDDMEFYLPGIRFDSSTGLFRDASGTPVAALRRVLIGSEIQLLRGVRIFVSDRSGRVHLSLVTGQPEHGLPWVETDGYNFPES